MQRTGVLQAQMWCKRRAAAGPHPRPAWRAPAATLRPAQRGRAPLLLYNSAIAPSCCLVPCCPPTRAGRQRRCWEPGAAAGPRPHQQQVYQLINRRHLLQRGRLAGAAGRGAGAAAPAPAAARRRPGSPQVQSGGRAAAALLRPARGARRSPGLQPDGQCRPAWACICVPAGAGPAAALAQGAAAPHCSVRCTEQERQSPRTHVLTVSLALALTVLQRLGSPPSMGTCPHLTCQVTPWTQGLVRKVRHLRRRQLRRWPSRVA